MRIFITVYIIVLSSSTLLAQNVGKAVYERAIDYVNCALAEFSITDQDGQPHILAYREQVKTNCDFYTLVEFLKTRKPQPLEKNLFLANAVDTYKNRYASTLSNQDLYEILSIELFREPEVVSFSSLPKRKTTYPPLKRNINDYLETVFKITPSVTRDINEEISPSDEVTTEMDEAAQDPINPAEQESIEMPETVGEDVPSDFYDGIDEYDEDNDMEWSDIFSWRRSWLFRFSLFFLSMAAFLYVVIPYYERSYKAEATQNALKSDKMIVLPEAVGLRSEVELLKNKQKILLEKIKAAHLELNELEDEG